MMPLTKDCLVSSVYVRRRVGEGIYLEDIAAEKSAIAGIWSVTVLDYELWSGP